MNEVALRFTHLGHAYQPGTWVFRGYSAAIDKGRTFALLGPNGRGKTTLLKILLNVLKSTEGQVETYGRLAFVPQLFQVSFDYTALDMVLMGRAKSIGLFSQPSARDEEGALAALDRFRLADLAQRPFHELSGGQRQMVVFARALVAEADTLILDEPTSALDLKNQSVILDWIGRLSQEDGLTVVFTTHHPHHALAVADDALLMLGESDYACGAARDVLTEGNLQALYGVPLKKLSFDHEGRTVETFAPVFQSRSTSC
ncbi:ABC transporter ATP-binding protein [Telmatospirillum sp.]|uniref:ABC transporter ATP-binding protein n=1 Tax=Telmatospirillum sp. TaxID=2079197 RepID=UPI0028501561|nr:ABC transporter ATP-binding protein [Telmatospirillum sp.]MDR3436091.1 ABC transporter ATP-binding protein [Telmatospirillum sp.]